MTTDPRLRRVPRLTGIRDTLRTEGAGWMLRRLRYRTPATAPGRAVHAWIRHLIRLVLAPARRARTGRRPSPSVLYAFYDLQVAPITYDAAWFALAADRERRRRGLERVHFVVVPGVVDGVREERRAYEAVVDREARRWRVHHMVLPIFGLVPAAAGHTLLPHRGAATALVTAAGADVYPRAYEPSLPIGHHPSEILEAARSGETGLAILESPLQARRFVDRWLAARGHGRRLVTVTLRNYEFMPARNSDIEAWVTFARGLPPAQYLPVFIPDADTVFDPPCAALEGLDVFPHACFNVPLRLALYERAFLNLGVSNGPFWLAALASRPRLLVFKMITPSVPQATEAFMRQLGFDVPGQLPFAGPFQRFVWDDDRLEVIEREFRAMVASIEAAGA